MKKKFGDDLQDAERPFGAAIRGVYLYKAAVEKAGSHRCRRRSSRRLPRCLRRSARQIQMNKQRHAPLTMYLGQVQADGTVKIVESFKNVDPGEQCPNLKSIV